MNLYNNYDYDYYKAGIKELPPPFAVANIYSAHRYWWKKKFYFSGESHKFHEVVFVLEGEVTVTEDDRIYHLKRGDLILHAPYEFHRIATDSGAKVIVFSFETAELFPEMLYDGFFVLSIEEEATFSRLFDKIYTFYYSDTESLESNLQREISSLLPAFFFSLSSPRHRHHSDTHYRSEEEYKKLVEEMRLSVAENLSLEDLALKNHTSVSYVKHLFHRYAGIGAKKYYTTLRLNEVIRLLENDVPVAEIARQLNFSSPEYLSLFFKKQMGVPPGKWRSDKKRS